VSGERAAIGAFRLLERLGIGALGESFLAVRDVDPDDGGADASADAAVGSEPPPPGPSRGAGLPTPVRGGAPVESPTATSTGRFPRSRYDPGTGGPSADGRPDLGVLPAARGTTRTRRKLVLKVLHPHLVGHREAQGLFEHEAQLLDALDHPAIPRLEGTGWFAGRPYLAMSWVPGRDLTSLLATGGQSAGPSAPNRGALGLRGAVELGVQLADALEHAHGLVDADGRSLDLVHRDVAPDNIRIDALGRVHLLDFGVAWSRWLPEGCRHGVRGTPRYMAPEQVRGELPDRRADVYALGALLFEGLSGRRVRSGEGPAVLIDAADRPAPPLLGLEPSLPPEVCSIVDQALVLDPRDRTADAGEVGASLRQAAIYLGLDAPGDGAALATRPLAAAG